MAPTPEQIQDALEGVHDPHVPVSLRRMGMVREVAVDAAGRVQVDLCIPCMACPGVGMLHERIRDAVMRLDGVTEVTVGNGWHLKWSRDMIEPEVRELMRANGIQV